MSEGMIRCGRRKGFTTVYRDVAQDARLTLKARGLYLLMQSLPDDWEYSVAGLAKKAGTGKDQIRSALNELMDVGYLVKEQTHDADGKFAGNIYILQEEAPPLSENPTTGNPTTRNPTEHNKEINNTPLNPPKGEGERKTRREKTEAKWRPEAFNYFWEFYRTHVRGEDRAGAIREWDKLKPDDALLSVMSHALAVQLESPEWKRGIGIPYACRWLRNRRWEDVAAAEPPEEEPEEVYGWET